MRKPIAAVLAAASTILLAAACGSSAASASAPSALPAAAQSAITAMTAHCTQDAAQLAAMVTETHQLEVRDGVTDESVTALAGHLATVVAAYKSRVSCVSPFADYLTLREGGS